MGDGFYRSKDPTNSIKVLKEKHDNVNWQYQHYLGSSDYVYDSWLSPGRTYNNTYTDGIRLILQSALVRTHDKNTKITESKC